MKHLFRFFTMLCAVAIGALAVASCNKDDDNDDGNDNVPQPMDTKVQLSSLEIDDRGSLSTIRFTIRFTYDSSNCLSSIRDGDGASEYEYETLVNFYWNPFSIFYNEKKLVTTLSPQGYITSAYARAYPSELTTFEYDNSGHLIKTVCEDKNGVYFRTERFLTWNAGLLTEIVENSQEGNYTEINTWDISYGNVENKSGIWPTCFWERYALWFEPYDHDTHYGSSFISFLLHAGLLGTAPTKLPSKIIKQTNYNGDVFRTELTYTLNDRGYVSNEKLKTYYKKTDYETLDYETINISYNYR